MKIVLTGGETGGHFYPLISVAESLRETSKKLKLLDPKLYFMAPNPYDEKALFDNRIIFKKNIAGKNRLYFSFENFFDLFKVALGSLTALWKLFLIYPDVVFSKGGYGAFPVLLAARFLRIPVVIHESDSIPGRVSLWSSKFAERIAVSFSDAVALFPKEKTALTGNPIRKDLIKPSSSGAREYLDLESNTPIILILGGSQGAQKINEIILSVLPELIQKYQIIHQTGKENIGYIKITSKVILKDSEFSNRYKAFGYLDVLAMKMSAGAADIVITRAGSGIFEVANWGLPSIVIPIPESISRDQRSNAFSYASTGAAIVVEEKNLSPHVLMSEVERVLNDENLKKSMSEAAKNFAQTDAGDKIAREIIKIALKHES
jgi:UDP-N-acetylglucosamine--N-acetylmuramyl-(pentapeptide) pyrophosphoryl-undecaprenol N-acetylglucosamine transferase